MSEKIVQLNKKAYVHIEEKIMPCKKYIPAWHLSIILLFHGHLHGNGFGFAVL